MNLHLVFFISENLVYAFSDCVTIWTDQIHIWLLNYSYATNYDRMMSSVYYYFSCIAVMHRMTLYFINKKTKNEDFVYYIIKTFLVSDRYCSLLLWQKKEN
jgi:hypothetical protein